MKTLRQAQGSRIAGYAAVFDHPDTGGDIVRRGAFASAAKSGLPLLWQHDTGRRIGTVDAVAEDHRGLRVIATLDAGRAAATGDGLSFGYRIKRSAARTYRELLDLELIEVSLVAQPMQPRARVIAVENLNQGDGNGL
jgi:HK97 family phage prohead protease